MNTELRILTEHNFTLFRLPAHYAIYAILFRLLFLYSSFCFNLCDGTLGTVATTGLLYQPRMIGGDYGEIGGIKIDRGNQSIRRKPAPAPLYPPQIPHD
jgi:hypothetical protein